MVKITFNSDEIKEYKMNIAGIILRISIIMIYGYIIYQTEEYFTIGNLVTTNLFLIVIMISLLFLMIMKWFDYVLPWRKI
jgi:hypothetical protein